MIFLSFKSGESTTEPATTEPAPVYATQCYNPAEDNPDNIIQVDCVENSTYCGYTSM